MARKSNYLHVFLALVLTAMFIFSLPVAAVQAASPSYVRTDGSDTNCDGKTDAADPGDGTIPRACAFATIQKAVDAAADGDTINVSAGTYTETDISITKGLTLQGAGSTVAGTVIDGSSSAATGNIFTIDLTAGDVTIDGFRILTAEKLNGIFSHATSSESTITLTHNYIEGWKTTLHSERSCTPPDNNYNVIVQNSQSTLVVQNNELKAGCSNSILIERNSGPTDVSFNTFDRSVDDVSSDAYFNMNYGAPDITALQKVSHNTIDMGSGTTFTYENRGTAISFTASFTGAAGGFTNIEITDNTITGLKAYRRGIGTWNNASAPGTTGGFDNFIVEGNVLSGVDPVGTTSIGVHLVGNSGKPAIRNNKFTNVDIAVQNQPWNSHITPAANTVVLDNIFQGGSKGIDWQGADSLTATCNYWNSLSGPEVTGNPGGNGVAFTGTVKFAPWLIYDTDGSPNPGFQLPTAFTVTPPGEVSAAVNDFRVLQNAVGCAQSGQTIDISGTFDWTNPQANAAYLSSYQNTTFQDIRGVEIPAGVNDLTITSTLDNAHIIGVGDVNDGSTIIYASFLFAEKTLGNTNLTVEKLFIDNFESAITLGWNNGGFFNGTMVRDNQITLAGDNGNQGDWLQNIAFYFWNGVNQTIRDNTVTFRADGTRTQGFSGPKPGASFGYQSGTTGGSAYNGLLITGNTFQVGSTSNTLEQANGIWENGHNDVAGTKIELTNNQFLGRTGDDFDRALLLSSQSDQLIISGNTFNGVDEVFSATRSQGHGATDSYTFTNNVLLNVGGADGIFLQNVTDDVTPVHVHLKWDINNTIDGETGIRGLNELSTQAAHALRPSSGASDIQNVDAVPLPVAVAMVNNNWGTVDRFTDTDGIGTGISIAFGFNTFSTIQAGIDAVASGGTVNVADGTYYGGVNILKPLTLVSVNGAAGTIIHGGLTNPAIYVVSIRSSDVTFNGFTVTNPMYAAPTGDVSGIVVAYYGDPLIKNVKILNNIVTEIGAADRTLSNLDTDWPSTGIVSAGAVDGLEIAGNTVFDIHLTASGADMYFSPVGIGVYGEIETKLTTNVSVHNNLVYNISATNTNGAIATGHGIAMGWASGDGTITNNEVHDVLGRAIYASNSNYGTVDVTGNTVYKAGVSGISFRNPAGGSITANNLYDNTEGITLGVELTTAPTISFNRLSGNDTGLNNQSSLSITAINNWWGCNTGPGQTGCDTTTGTVAAEPWLVLTTTADPTFLSFRATSAVKANLIFNSDGSNTSATGYVPNGIPVVFSAPLGGTIDPLNSETLNGSAGATFTPPVSGKTLSACAKVDNALVCVDITKADITFLPIIFQ